MKTGTYKCQAPECGKVFTKTYLPDDFVLVSVMCDCGGMAFRTFGHVDFTKEPDTVSTAIQTMMYSSLPSGRDKAAF